MATSGSTDFSLTRDNIIRRAYSKIGKGTEGQDLSDYQIDVASDSLNMMVKTWQSAGLNLWKKIEGEFSLVKGRAEYRLGPGGDYKTRPLRILSARRKDNTNIEIPMSRLGREEYDDYPNKTVQGVPTQYYYLPLLTKGQFVVWPTPSSAVQKVVFTGTVQIEDFDAANNDPDFPQEWLETIVYGLASRLIDDFGAPPGVANRVIARAELLYDDLLGWDQENASIYFQPAYEVSG